MSKCIEAFESEGGSLFRTKKEADDAEVCAAVEVLATTNKAHLRDVATGRSGDVKVRNAIKLIADKLPPIAEAESAST